MNHDLNHPNDNYNNLLDNVNTEHPNIPTEVMASLTAPSTTAPSLDPIDDTTRIQPPPPQRNIGVRAVVNPDDPNLPDGSPNPDYTPPSTTEPPRDGHIEPTDPSSQVYWNQYIDTEIAPVERNQTQEQVFEWASQNQMFWYSNPPIDTTLFADFHSDNSRDAYAEQYRRQYVETHLNDVLQNRNGNDTTYQAFVALQAQMPNVPVSSIANMVLSRQALLAVGLLAHESKRQLIEHFSTPDYQYNTESFYYWTPEGTRQSTPEPTPETPPEPEPEPETPPEPTPETPPAEYTPIDRPDVPAGSGVWWSDAGVIYDEIDGLMRSIYEADNAHTYADQNDTLVWFDTPMLTDETLPAYRIRYIKKHIDEITGMTSGGSPMAIEYAHLSRTRPDLNYLQVAAVILAKQATMSYELNTYESLWITDTTQRLWSPTGVHRYVAPPAPAPEPVEPTPTPEPVEPTPPETPGLGPPQIIDPPHIPIPPHIIPPFPPQPPSTDPIDPPIFPDRPHPDRPLPPPPDPDMPVDPDHPSIPPADHHINITTMDDLRLDNAHTDDFINEHIHIERREVNNYIEYYMDVKDGEGKEIESYTIYHQPEDGSVQQLKQFWSMLFVEVGNVVNGYNGSLFSTVMGFVGKITQPFQKATSTLLAGVQGYKWLGPHLSFGTPLNILDCIAAVHDASYMVEGYSNSEADSYFLSRCSAVKNGLLSADFVDMNTGEKVIYDGRPHNHMESFMLDTAEELITKKHGFTTLPLVNKFFGKTDPKEQEEKVALYKRVNDLRHEITEMEQQNKNIQRDFYESRYNSSRNSFEKTMYKKIVLSLIRGDRKKSYIVHKLINDLHRQEELLLREYQPPKMSKLVLI